MMYRKQEHKESSRNFESTCKNYLLYGIFPVINKYVVAYGRYIVSFFLQAHVVSAFEQSLSSMTQRLQHLTATAEKKVGVTGTTIYNTST